MKDSFIFVGMKELLSRNGVTIKEVAKLWGCHLNTASSKIDAPHTMSVKQFDDLCYYMDYDTNEMFNHIFRNGEAPDHYVHKDNLPYRQRKDANELERLRGQD